MDATIDIHAKSTRAALGNCDATPRGDELVDVSRTSKNFGYQFEAVLFDLDDTLLSTETLLDEIIIEHIRTTYKVAITHEHLGPLRGMTDTGAGSWSDVLISQFGLDTTDVQLCSDVYAIMHDKLSTCSIMPGAADVVLGAAARGKKLAIVTSSRAKDVATKRLGKEALFRHMQTIVTVEDVAPRTKPSPDGYLLAAQRLGVPISRCLVFEDSIPGIKAGVAAGATVIAVPAPQNREEAARVGAHLVLASMEEFPLERFLGPLPSSPGSLSSVSIATSSSSSVAPNAADDSAVPQMAATA